MLYHIYRQFIKKIYEFEGKNSSEIIAIVLFLCKLFTTQLMHDVSIYS